MPSTFRLLHALPAAGVLLLACGAAAPTAAQPLKVDALVHHDKGATYRFPWVGGAGHDTQAAQQINHWIFLQHFDGVPVPARREDGVKSKPGSIAALDFAVTRNDAHVLALTLEGEFCSAYCEPFDIDEAFDAATGRPLSAQDLFTPAGLKRLGQDMQQANTQAMRGEIDRLRAQPDREDRDDAIGLYEECLQTREDGSYGSTWLFRQMRLTPEAAAFAQERCSNHAMQALDELGEFKHRFAISTLQDKLTPYGRKVLLGEGQASEPASRFGRVFNGSIANNLPIVVQLNAPYEDGSLGGAYFYVRHRQPIHLSGQWKDGVLSLDEEGDGGTAAHWTLRPAGGAGGWRGEWKQGQRTLPVQLAP